MKNTPHIERNWVFRETIPVPGGFLAGNNYPDIILQTLLRRGLSDPVQAEQFLDFRKYIPSSPYELPDMEKGVARILRAISDDQLIGVWGDFDVDGQTSTAILVSALRQVIAKVIHHIPVRGPESHGIGLKALQDFLDQGVKVILTCDTGISAVDAIAYAQSRGIDVVVTDHHLLPEVLPPACALINPRRLPASHPLSSLPGAGTALKFAEALLAEKGLAENAKMLHDLAALGCVADLAELSGETRYLVQSGLNQIRSEPRPPLAAMLEAAGVAYSSVGEEHISFNLAPRLNAVGRLDDANPMVNFLLSSDPVEIAVTVSRLEGLNDYRKTLCDQVFQGSMAMLEQDRALLDQPILILHHPEWPAGIVGIVASRLVELFHRPVILLVTPPGEAARGSARSVDGIDITAALTLNHQHLLSFGGHPMAAGLALDTANLETFKRGMNKTILNVAAGQVTKPDLIVDAVLSPSAITLEFAHSLDLLAPFGPGNPPLIFGARGMQIINTSDVGKLREHLLVNVEDSDGNTARLIWWNGNNLPLPEGRFDLAYTARASNFRGEDQLQFEWIDYRDNPEETPLQAGKGSRKRINFDNRHSNSPDSHLSALVDAQSILVWKEGNDGYPVKGVDRHSIEPCSALAIWSLPPDAQVLQQLIQTVNPDTLYWFLVAPHQHQWREFLRTIGSTVKHGLAHGQSNFLLADLAAQTATTEKVAALGLQWLVSSGHARVIELDAAGYTLAAGGEVDIAQRAVLQKALQKEFLEIQSFSKYLQRVDLDQLVHELK